MSDSEIVNPERVRRVLRGIELFEMVSIADLERIQKTGEIEELGPGDLLFAPEDPSDRVHAILDGAIEIIRTTPDHPEPVPVAYISPGEIVGDMALFTGTPRRSGGRVPERAVVWTLGREAFEGLVSMIPGYGTALARLFARRLEGFITHMRRQDRRKELSGKLAFFDLPIVVQTLVTSSQTGILTLVDGDGETYAEVLLRDGSIERARRGHLEGEEAFFELFASPEGSLFVFRTLAAPDADSISKVTIGPNAMSLLMEAMRLVDELPGLKERLGGEDRVFKTRRRKLKWGDSATRDLAKSVHGALRKPGTMLDLVGGVPCSSYRLYQIVAKLEDTRQIE